MKTVILFSGGIDSTTLLHFLVADEVDCLALSFRYGQRHAKELDYAKATARRLHVPHRIIDLPNIFTGSALTGDLPVPQGHYTDASMAQTVVPNRNMVMLSIATAIAIAEGYEEVAYAAHADDRGTYPDCRPEFVRVMQDAIRLCDDRLVSLFTPFLDYTKREIVRIGSELGVDYEQTWSCYRGEAEPCGTCGACSARAEALA